MPAFQQPPSPISPGCGCKSNEHLRRQVGPLQRKCTCCVRLTCSALRHHEPHVRGDKWTCLWRCCKEVALTRGGVFCSILIQVFGEVMTRDEDDYCPKELLQLASLIVKCVQKNEMYDSMTCNKRVELRKQDFVLAILKSGCLNSTLLH